MGKENEDDALVSLARETVEEYVRSGKTKPAPLLVTPELAERAGAFICLKKFGQLRGCIGTIEPTQSNLAAEIVQNAISASTCDPRFDAVQERELGDLEYTVDVMGAPEPVEGLADLDVKKYGVIVESGHKRGLLLPDLEGVDTVEDQVMIAMRKAGIYDGEPVCLYRFEVQRHGGK